jgi:hypothetical protein
MVLVGMQGAMGSPALAGTPRDPGSEAPREGATSVPFKGTLDGLHTSRVPLQAPFVHDRFEATGEATHLGQLTLVIEATVNFGARPVTGVGTYAFTAANGDRLAADQTGFSTLVSPGVVQITEHAVIDPSRSTGRFAGAEGEFTVTRLADAATGVGGITSGSFDGSISLAVSARG